MTIHWTLSACTGSADLGRFGYGTLGHEGRQFGRQQRSFLRNPGQFLIQLKAVVITIVYSFIVSFVLLKIVDAFMVCVFPRTKNASVLISRSIVNPVTLFWISPKGQRRSYEIYHRSHSAGPGGRSAPVLEEKEIHLVTVSTVLAAAPEGYFRGLSRSQGSGTSFKESETRDRRE